MDRIWVNKWQECSACNYDTHKCPACGDDLDHEGYDSQGNHHTVEWCRPDLFQHEPGELCTWPHLNKCYWNHETNRIKEKDEL